MKTVFLATLPALGMLASLAFATRPIWFLDRLEARHPRRRAWKFLFCALFFAGVAGWFSVFQAAAESILHLKDGTLFANVLTAGVCWMIYLAAGRGESLAHAEKLRLQAERNAAIRSRTAE